MARILVCDGMDSNALKILEGLGYEMVNEHYDVDELKIKVNEFDGMVVRSATKVRKPIIDAALESGRLQLVIRAGVGVDNIDVAYATSKGINVRNTPRASSASVAELAIGHMFAIARNIHIANVTVREGKWCKKQYKGVELARKKLGLIGFGRIARETGRRAKALGMDVCYTDILGKQPEDEGYTYLPMDELLGQSDFISLHIPFDKEKGATLNKEAFAKVKDGVYIINTARGGVVEEEALLEALNSGKVAGAAVDVFEEEPTKNKVLCEHPKVSLTPHIGASTKEAQKRIGLEIVDLIAEYFPVEVLKEEKIDGSC